MQGISVERLDPFDAIVLAGGRSRRLGGVDKAGIDVGGRSLLDRVLGAVTNARQVIVVGPARALPAGVVGTAENPPGGGPVAGLAAGLALVEAPLVAVLACDLPFLSHASVLGLVDALCDDAGSGFDGAQLVDAAGQAQPLAAIYRAAPLREALAALRRTTGTPMRDVVRQVRMLDVRTEPEQAWDCDTWDDVRRARKRLDDNPAEES